MIITGNRCAAEQPPIGALMSPGILWFGTHRLGASGDFVIGFIPAIRYRSGDPASPCPRRTASHEPLSLAVIESVEEAIYNSLFMAHTVIARYNNTCYSLTADKMVALYQRFRVKNAN
jgi:L-aminopeptidase/D-esterase-like protein